MNRKTLYLFLLIGLIFLIFFGLGERFLYAKSGIEKWLPFILIFAGFPFLLYKCLAQYIKRQDMVLGLAIGSVLIIGPVFGIWSDKISEEDLSKNGVKTKAIVIEKWWHKPKSQSGEWLLRCKFTAKGQLYHTFSYEDKDNQFEIGDTLTVIYSKRNPENSKILEFK